MQAQATRIMYVVVDVMRGVAVGAGVFERMDDAQDCARRLEETRNLNEDDVQVFECALNEDPEE